MCLLTLPLLINMFKMVQTLEKRFSLVEINNNSDFDLSANFKSNFTINYMNGTTRLKCSSYCALETKCLLFSFSGSSKVCFLFSNDQIESNILTPDSKTKVYKKMNLAEVSTTTKPVESTTTKPPDYTCVNQVCTCIDTLR